MQYQIFIFKGKIPKLRSVKLDGLVKSQLFILVVIPAKAGIQSFQKIMDSGFRRSDELSYFLRPHQT